MRPIQMARRALAAGALALSCALAGGAGAAAVPPPASVGVEVHLQADPLPVLDLAVEATWIRLKDD